jgi:hypothetical protein
MFRHLPHYELLGKRLKMTLYQYRLPQQQNHDSVTEENILKHKTAMAAKVTQNNLSVTSCVFLPKTEK